MENKDENKDKANKITFPVSDQPKLHALYDAKDQYITTIYNLDYKKEIVKRVNAFDTLDEYTVNRMNDLVSKYKDENLEDRHLIDGQLIALALIRELFELPEIEITINE
jgi:hypothetical protein